MLNAQFSTEPQSMVVVVNYALYNFIAFRTPLEN